MRVVSRFLGLFRRKRCECGERKVKDCYGTWHPSCARYVRPAPIVNPASLRHAGPGSIVRTADVVSLAVPRRRHEGTSDDIRPALIIGGALAAAALSGTASGSEREPEPYRGGGGDSGGGGSSYSYDSGSSDSGGDGGGGGE